MRDVRVTVLGTAQDGGVPQPGCMGECCERIRQNDALRRLPVSLGIVGADGSTHLIEVSRHLGEQLEIWRSVDQMSGPPESVSLTHYHLGHCDGLRLFGKEAMNTKGIPVYCGMMKPDWIYRMGSEGYIELRHYWNADMAKRVRPANAWTARLEKLGMEGDTDETPIVQPSTMDHGLGYSPTPECGFTIHPHWVPHRGNTPNMGCDGGGACYALLIETGDKNLLFMPDHDSWLETLDKKHTGPLSPRQIIEQKIDQNDVLSGQSIRDWLGGMNVDIALIDGTFWDQYELKNRDMAKVPHPTVRESLDLLGPKQEGDPDIRFFHLNHTNPLCNPDSPELAELTSMGWGLVKEGDSFTLERL